jgi:hypothetical protein
MTNPIIDTTPNDAPKGIVLSERAYDILKDVDLVILPASGTAYAATAAILHLPYALEVVGLIGVAVFVLGVLLKISSVQYKAKAAVAAIKAAAIVSPEVTVSPIDATKVEITETATGPGIAADPAQVVVDSPSQ